MTLEERIQKYLDCCDPAVSHSHGHNTTFRVACALWNGFGLSVEQTFQWLQYYNQKCEPPWSLTDLMHKAQNAGDPRAAHTQARGYLLGPGAQVSPLPEPYYCAPSVPKALYDPAYLESFTAELSNTVIDSEYLEIRSQFTCHNRSPAGFLHKVFHPGEHVWVTEKTTSGQGLVWTHEGLVQNLAELNHLRRGRDGVWFLSNPIDGAPHQLERLKSEFNAEGISFRATECITDWRHAVLETDDAPEELWLKALALLPLPIVAIYHSGKRGAHALINLGARTLGEWRERLAPHCEHLLRLGACSGTLKPVCLSRLPNCMREQTKRLQQLLYLAPDTDGTPIVQRPVREDPSADWDRLRRARAFWSRSEEVV